MTRRTPLARKLGVWVCAAVMAALFGLPQQAAAQAQFTEESSTLPDGTEYRIRVPANWNRVLIRDFDYAAADDNYPGANDNARSLYLLKQGYALSGTKRHALRRFRYDPAREIANLDRVLDLFEARFGRPDRVIQYGCSGGGHMGLAIAEDFSDRVDGVIATGAHTPVWIMNTYLDGWFALKALIAQDLDIANLPPDFPSEIGNQLTGTTPTTWRRAIDAAQQTPEGRARIALAFTVGQWPAWVNNLTPQPNLEDVAALQHSMYHSAYQMAENPGGTARVMFENAADGKQMSWNTGVDYRELFENGNEFFKRAVRRLYVEAGLDLEADLRRINEFPRIEASDYALEFWNAPGRNVRGDPKIPMLRMHEIGDPSVPVSLVQGYEAQMRAHGKEELFRAAFVNAPGHCNFRVAESAAAIEIMMRRLDTGKWERTDPDELNKLAESLGTGTTPRFTSIDRFKQVKYNRVWAPE
ncbi:MAG: hypothetical protein HYX73_00340 [Acidobacteria bacterium]|nr:hypothetical protein [Acidobacteriota bacterium]